MECANNETLLSLAETIVEKIEINRTDSRKYFIIRIIADRLFVKPEIVYSGMIPDDDCIVEMCRQMLSTTKRSVFIPFETEFVEQNRCVSSDFGRVDAVTIRDDRRIFDVVSDLESGEIEFVLRKALGEIIRKEMKCANNGV